jgi:hypothetical protein
MIPYQSAPFSVTTAAINDVAVAYEIPNQPLGVIWRDARDAVFDNPVIPDVLRHYRRYTIGNVIGCMKLAAKRSSLNVATSTLANVAERRVFPILWNVTDYLFNSHLGSSGKSDTIVSERL